MLFLKCYIKLGVVAYTFDLRSRGTKISVFEVNLSYKVSFKTDIEKHFLKTKVNQDKTKQKRCYTSYFSAAMVSSVIKSNEVYSS